jgi:hypothetical protein
MLLDIRFRGASEKALPPEHPWWLRDSAGRRSLAWGKDFYKLDPNSAALQAHAAAQCRAAVLSGVVDGCYFNLWEDDAGGAALLKKARAAVGEDALLAVGTGKKLVRSVSDLNGQLLFMDLDKFPPAWDKMAQALVSAESSLRPPHLVALSVTQTPFVAQNLHLATTLVLTHSDGYVLYSTPVGVRGGWGAQWPPFWNKSLGRPQKPGELRGDGSTIREFEHGTVVYNPPGGRPSRISFHKPHKSAANGQKSKTFTIPPGDGDIFLK